jgi:type I restriction enzyme S subunit
MSNPKARGNEKLAESWTAAPVTDLCELIRGVSYAKGEESNIPQGTFIPLLRANNIQSDLIFNDLRYVPPQCVSAEQMLQLGDVVVAMSSGSKAVVGKTAWLDHQWRGTFGAFCGVLRPSTLLDSRYFGLFFQSQKYRDFVSEASAGVNINNLKRDHFTQINLPIAPLAEQRRIAHHVTELLVKIDSARDHLSRVPAILKCFRQAVLAAACSGRLTETSRDSEVSATPSSANSHPRLSEVEPLFDLPISWRWVSFESVCKDITVGHVGPMTHEYQKTGVPFLRSQNVREFRFDPKRLKYVSRDFHVKLNKSALHPGDVAVVRSGYAGVACVIPNEITEANCADLVIIRPSTALDPYYACIFINSDVGRAHVNGVKVGIAQSHFNIGAAKKTPIPLPPVEEQQKIVSRVNALFRIADAVEAQTLKATRRAEKLTQSILTKAFRGELVPTEAELARREGREYEPASVLLKRIKAERASDTKPSRMKRSMRKASAHV